MLEDSVISSRKLSYERGNPFPRARKLIALKENDFLCLRGLRDTVSSPFAFKYIWIGRMKREIEHDLGLRKEPIACKLYGDDSSFEGIVIVLLAEDVYLPLFRKPKWVSEEL